MSWNDPCRNGCGGTKADCFCDAQGTGSSEAGTERSNDAQSELQTPATNTQPIRSVNVDGEGFTVSQLNDLFAEWYNKSNRTSPVITIYSVKDFFNWLESIHPTTSHKREGLGSEQREGLGSQQQCPDVSSVVSLTSTVGNSIEQEQLFIKCKQCNGTGTDMEMRTEVTCCGHTNEGGECCGNPTGVSDWFPIQCEVCEATGFEPIQTVFSFLERIIAETETVGEYSAKMVLASIRQMCEENLNSEQSIQVSDTTETK